MSLNPQVLSSVVTVVWFLAFIGLCAWAWSGRRRKDFDAAARLPLEEVNEHVAARPEGGR